MPPLLTACMHEICATGSGCHSDVQCASHHEHVGTATSDAFGDHCLRKLTVAAVRCRACSTVRVVRTCSQRRTDDSGATPHQNRWRAARARSSGPRPLRWGCDALPRCAQASWARCFGRCWRRRARCSCGWRTCCSSTRRWAWGSWASRGAGIRTCRPSGAQRRPTRGGSTSAISVLPCWALLRTREGIISSTPVNAKARIDFLLPPCPPQCKH